MHPARDWENFTRKWHQLKPAPGSDTASFAKSPSFKYQTGTYVLTQAVAVLFKWLFCRVYTRSNSKRRYFGRVCLLFRGQEQHLLETESER